jgi:uncharacterized membrane protein YfcA
MEQPDLLQLLAAFAIALMAGAINSIAGGGTILTFPFILALVGDSKVANITSTLGLWPASLGGAWGYRRDIAHLVERFRPFFLISLLGGGAGACLLLWTEKRTFDAIVPFLILGATLLFATQGTLSAWLARRQRLAAATSNHSGVMAPSLGWWPVLAAQVSVALYGGYFGAGIGIMMLALLGFLGLTDIYQMNGLKNLGGLCVNGLAVAVFIISDRFHQASVNWPIVAAMAVGGIMGGYYCVPLARKVGPRVARRIIIVVGLAGAAYTAWSVWGKTVQ